MNRGFLVFGLLVMVVCFFYVPYDVPDIMARAVAGAFGNRSLATELEYGLLWDKPDSGAVINTALWLGTLGGIAFVTFVLAHLTAPKDQGDVGT